MLFLLSLVPRNTKALTLEEKEDDDDDDEMFFYDIFAVSVVVIV